MSPAIDLRREPILNELFAFAGAPPARRPDGVLLTGPNAFVGVFVLRELLAHWRGEIHCLMRAESQAHAIQRMEEVARRWAVGPLDLERVSFHLGDCTQPRWGMSDDSHRQVKERTGSVIHLALMARWDLPYSHYQESWLPDLARTIEFCGDAAHPKALHYPSSYNSHFLRDASDFARLDTSAWHSGYTAFKWVAEQAVRRAMGGNLAGCVYDIPLVIGSGETGLCPPQYSARQILKMFVETGVGLDFEFRVISVDWLARILVHNVVAEREGAGLRYVRPVFPDVINLAELYRALAPARPFSPGEREELLARTKNRAKAEFLLPADFGSIIRQGHALPPVLPPTFDASQCPTAFEVFRANTQVWMRDIENRMTGAA